MSIYKLFNITVDSEIKLTDFEEKKLKQPDYRIIEEGRSPINKNFKRFHTIYSDRKPWLSYYKFKKHYGLRFHSYADFTLNGRDIQYHKRKKTNVNTLRHLINDQVIPLTLSLADNNLFHASTVKIGNSAVSFHAPTGHGKSTLASYFLKKNHKLVTDDSLLLEYRSKNLFAYPSYRGIRLWPETAKKLFKNRYSAEDVSQYNTKKLIDIKSGFLNNSRTPLKLRSLYFIIKSGRTYIEKPSKSEAFSLLIGNIFRLDFKNKEINSRQFKFINRVIDSVDIYKLNYEMNFDSLETSYNLIIENNLN